MQADLDFIKLHEDELCIEVEIWVYGFFEDLKIVEDVFDELMLVIYDVFGELALQQAIIRLY